MNVQKAIQILNDHSCVMPTFQLDRHLSTIVQAAVQNDPHAIRWLWLLHWKPQQLLN